MRKGLRRRVALVLLGTVPLGTTGCAACRVAGKATVATVKTCYKATKTVVVGTGRLTKKGIQAIARDPEAAPGGLEGTQVAYNPLDPDETRPADVGPSKPVETPQSRDAGTLVVEDAPPAAPTRGGGGVKHNLPPLDVETMIAKADSASGSKSSSKR
jgi:hypothetical protein